MVSFAGADEKISNHFSGNHAFRKNTSTCAPWAHTPVTDVAGGGFSGAGPKPCGASKGDPSPLDYPMSAPTARSTAL